VKSSILRFPELLLSFQPVCNALVAMNHRESSRETLQAFGVPQKQITSRQNTVRESVYQPALLILIQID
jgi:hypothetical protein